MADVTSHLRVIFNPPIFVVYEMRPDSLHIQSDVDKIILKCQWFFLFFFFFYTRLKKAKLSVHVWLGCKPSHAVDDHRHDRPDHADAD